MTIRYILVGAMVCMLTSCGQPPPLSTNNDKIPAKDMSRDQDDSSDMSEKDLSGEECAFMARECVDAESYRVCIRTGLGTTWSNSSRCVGGVCSGAGQCCDGGCVDGEKVCTPQGIQTCTMQASGCLAFGEPVACPDGKSCNREGMCVDQCEDTCTPNQTQCVMEGGPTFKACTKGPSGCFQLEATERSCAPSERCYGGICKVPPCQHNCAASEIGKTRCSGQTEEQCSANGEGCRDWRPTGNQCNNNNCPCLTGKTGSGEDINNICYYPFDQASNCPPVAAGGYCDPDGNRSFDDADWTRGYHEYQSICGN